MQQAFIYALVDPRITDPVLQIRYVGMTTKTLARRLHLHLSEARKYPRPYRRLKWIRSLFRAEVSPQIIALDTIDVSVAFDRERELIAHYRKLGCRLVNSTDGGEGLLNPSPEIRAKIGAATRNISLEERARRSTFMRGRKHSPEVLAKMSAAHKGKPGRPVPNDAREKIRRALIGNKHFLGHRHSLETIARLSAAKMGNSSRLGLSHTEDTKRKLSLAHAADKSSSAKLTWNKVRAIRAEYALGKTRQSILCRRYGIAPGTLCVMLQGKTWVENQKAV